MQLRHSVLAGPLLILLLRKGAAMVQCIYSIFFMQLAPSGDGRSTSLALIGLSWCCRNDDVLTRYLVKSHPALSVAE